MKRSGKDIAKLPPELIGGVDMESLPRHVAVIMDGNRRWSRERKFPAIEGHRRGVETYRKIVELSAKLGLDFLTAYAFSSENWNRTAYEVSVLLNLFKYYARKEREDLKKNDIRFQMVGDVDAFPEALRKEFLKTQEYTRDCKRLTINLAVNYGAREEILKCTRQIAESVKKGEIQTSQINEELFSKFLYTSGIPDPELLIRTSGEIRLSNFLLWQSAYTELYFTDKFWPEFDEMDFMNAIRSYQARQRRFGK